MKRALDIAAAARHPEVAALDLSVLGPGDLANLILQRSEVLFDRPRPGEAIRAWEAGDEGPIARAVEEMGDEIARRAAGVIRAEYDALRPRLAALAPRRVADIGCGYALFDLFLARDLNPELLLIDLEANERRHFSYHAEGAAYSSLAVARRLLEANGVAPGRIVTLNPREADPAAAGPVDLAVSFLSCGFHYPAATYLPFFTRAVRPGGSVILDLRARTAAAQLAGLGPIGSVADLPAPSKARRILLTRSGADARD